MLAEDAVGIGPVSTHTLLTAKTNTEFAVFRLLLRSSTQSLSEFKAYSQILYATEQGNLR
jgi:hypothetical protein